MRRPLPRNTEVLAGPAPFHAMGSDSFPPRPGPRHQMRQLMSHRPLHLAVADPGQTGIQFNQPGRRPGASRGRPESRVPPDRHPTSELHQPKIRRRLSAPLRHLFFSPHRGERVPRKTARDNPGFAASLALDDFQKLVHSAGELCRPHPPSPRHRPRSERHSTGSTGREIG